MIVRAKCQECGVIYIKSKTSHPEVCGNCTCKIPINAGKHPRPDQVADEEYTPPTPTIKSGNRYMSKVDWASDKVKKKIKRERANGRTLSYIARCLKVSRSTLTKANERHKLYVPHLNRINQC